MGSKERIKEKVVEALQEIAAISYPDKSDMDAIADEVMEVIEEEFKK